MVVRKNQRWEDVKKGDIDLGVAVQYFDTYNRSEGKSPRTVEWYNEVLDLFLRWLREEGLPSKLGSLGEMEVRRFILYLRQRNVHGKPLSSHTIANRVRALRAFFSWLAESRYLASNPLQGLRAPKTAEILIEPLTPEEVERLFRHMNPKTTLGARNTAIVALFLDTGLRLSELVSLKEADVHLADRYLKVFGKGMKERMVSLGALCQRALLNYDHHFRGEPAHAGVDTFFLTLDGYPMTNKAVKSMMDRLARTAGVPRLHPHLLRHTYATWFLINGGDVFLLKQNLGHSTLVTVEIYRHIAGRQAAVISGAFSPLDRMKSSELRKQQGRAVPEARLYPSAGLKKRNGERLATRTWRGGHRGDVSIFPRR